MARRSRGEGALFKRSDGRWEGQILVDTLGGRRRRKSLYGATKAEVVEKLAAERRCLRAGLPPTDGRQRTEDYLRWWVNHVVPATVSAASQRTYAAHVEHYLIPALGSVPLVKLAPAHVTQLMDLMASGSLGRGSRPLATATQAQARKVLGRALRRAMAEGLVDRNVAQLADGPKVRSRVGRGLSSAELASLMSAMKGERLEAAFLVQLGLGLRLGELLGLQWGLVDLSAGVVAIRHQLQRQPREGLALAELKTTSSRRNLVLPGELASVLRRWGARQSRERLRRGSAWANPLDLVFTTPVGTPIDASNYRRELKRVARQAGLGELRTHDLRHTAGSMLFAAGLPMKVISEHLGHSSERVTADLYVHTVDASRRAVAESMSALLSEARTGGAAGRRS